MAELIFIVTHSCSNLPLLFTNKEWATVEFESDGCLATLDQVNYLEHVEVIVNIEYPIRGQLEIDLISPSGKRNISFHLILISKINLHRHFNAIDESASQG